jgi:hypothetical protein
MDETQVVEVSAPVADVNPVVTEAEAVTQFSADDIAKAREQEKAKLYPQMEKMREELAETKRLADELRNKEVERQAAIEKEAAERARLQKEQEESELSAKDLLAKKEQEWTARLEQERLEREKAFALLEKERMLQELNNYRQLRVEEERDAIIPELIDLIEGSTSDEIEQSIANLKEKSARILDSAAQASANARREMAGTRVTAPASGPLDNDTEQRSYTPESLRDMSLADYAKNRAKLLGDAAGNRGRGLFG